MFLVVFGTSTLASFLLYHFLFGRPFMAAVTLSILTGLLLSSYFLFGHEIQAEEMVDDYKTSSENRDPPQSERSGIYSLTAYF
jgi:hypothetical protein